MPDLLIHIGLAKTGTSTLQARMLSGRPGYLGKNKVDFPPQFGDRDLVDEFQELASQCHIMEPDAVRAAAEGWVQVVVAWAAEQQISGPLCMSDENFAHWPVDRRNQHNRHPVRHSPARWGSAPKRERPIPVARFIKDHIVPAWQPYGKVELCVVLRNQSAWLGSLYAQRSNGIMFPSSKAFEAQVRHMIALDEPYLDWYGLVQDLQEAVGADNLTVLFFEDARTEEYWRALGTFFGIVDADWKAFSGGTHRVNERRKGTAGWNIRPLNLLLLMYQAYTQHWPERRRQLFYRTCHHLIRSVIAPGLDLFRKKTFSLSDECRAEIRAHCRSSNAKLAALVSRDLEELGY